jgi:O-antigen/teichoic acid export membrane protein
VGKGMIVNFSKIKESKLFCSAGVYTIGHILNAALPFMLLPVLTRYLSPEDYGITAMLTVLMGIYFPFVGLNLHGFVSVSYFKYRKDFPIIVSTTFLLMISSLLVAILVTYTYADVISSLSFFPCGWLWVIVCLCVTDFFVMVLQVIQQVKNHAKEYIVIQVGQTLINLILSLVLVVLLAMNWKGRILAQVLTGIIFTFIAFFLFRKWGLMKLQFNVMYARKALAYGIPLIPHALCGVFIVAADRLLISKMVGLEEVGIFTVGASIGKGIELLGSAFNNAFCPWLYAKLKDFDDGKDNDYRKVVRFSYTCMIGFLSIAVIYSLCMPYFLAFFVGQKFQEASQYIIYFALSSALHAIYYLVTNYIFYRQKTQYLAMITFSSGGLHIGITYLLINAFGTIGAAYASVITQTVITICTWWLGNKVYPMPWALWKR